MMPPFKISEERLQQALDTVAELANELQQTKDALADCQNEMKLMIPLHEAVAEKDKEVTRQLAQSQEVASKLAEALKQFVAGEPWGFLSCCKCSPTKGCALCGRYYDANEALVFYAAHRPAEVKRD